MMKRFLSLVLLIVLFGAAMLPVSTLAKTVEELREELRQKKDQLKNTEERIRQFQSNIQEKKREARTLKDQITLLDESIDELLLDLERTDTEIEKAELEIETVKAEMAIKEAEIAHQKVLLGEYIRGLHGFEQQSGVTVFLKYQTFSEAMNEAATIQELQRRAQDTLENIQQIRDELDAKRRDLEDFQQTLKALQTRQQRQKDSLSGQRTSKTRILDLTHAQEAQFQDLLGQAKATHDAAEREIRNLDALIREELRKQGVGTLPGVGVLDWPISPDFGVSCEFHCTGYPYQYLIGPHTGMDIPTNVGTPIKATSDGYVARAHDSNGPGYSYVMLLHGNGVSTVYGHLSGFAVKEDSMITRGTVIGYSGGAPGMRGAGLSSGPHLHFEVRENGIPVNPRKYL